MNDTVMQTQIAVLGGGPAGYVAAVRAARLGAKVTLVEERALGGVCLNRGCIPAKALLHSALRFSEWAAEVNNKDKIVRQLGMGVAHILSSSGVAVITGYGTVLDAHTIAVQRPDGGNTAIKCTKMILATGAKPLIPKIKGIDSDGVLTSDELLDLDTLPLSMMLIGAGVIGLEFAVMLAKAGVKVTVMELAERILPAEDSEIAAELYKIMRRKGIGFKLSAAVTEIKCVDEQLSVSFITDGKESMMAAEKILMATGREFNTKPFAALGLAMKNGAVAVNNKMETSVKDVYAAGDIAGGRLLAHLAFMEGKVAAENALGHESHVNYHAVPACVYTEPEIALVGMSEQEAVAQGINPKFGRFDFRNNGRAATLRERDGFVKVIADENNVIIGAQILGANASELISELTLAITLSVKAEVIADMIHPHPALAEAVWEACADLCGRAIHK
ncbi:MAG: dihydrolipoyl dehydrogenase [Firmicutes bacterium]|nr:dihydrolipoyl dehydrogenase [Bacillota bacterium]